MQTDATTPNIVAKSFTGFKLCATTHNNMQQGVKRTQHVTCNNVGSFWPTMLHPFARGLTIDGIKAILKYIFSRYSSGPEEG